ncbi:MAG: ribosome small subunit-dependent GTPase A [Woeseiaceae bacterium]|nr:ribosome small subunit-dependent GTPase A [Woeseiaceae bacterium]
MSNSTGTVIATFSRRMDVRLDDGEIVSARIKGKTLKPVCGDFVELGPLPGEPDWLITSVSERKNELTRPNVRGSAEVLAANIDQLVLTVAALPAADWFIVDRYLAAAENMPADAAIVYNKSDIEAPNDNEELRAYADLGYPVIVTSASEGDGIDRLAAQLSDRVSIFVGQSGVGKSSLINALLGKEAQKIAEISRKHDEGKHTTVNSRMLPLTGGGEVIDSPGVRDYAPAISDISHVAHGFREIRTAAAHCRFANCRHLEEPGCAVKQAVEDGKILARRLESYRRLLRLTERLGENRY